MGKDLPCFSCQKGALATPRSMQNLVDHVSFIHLAPGEAIHSLSDEDDNYHFVCKGMVKKGTRDASGNRFVFQIINEGELVEKPFFLQDPGGQEDHLLLDELYVKSLTAARMGVLPKFVVREAMKYDHEAVLRLGKEICSELRFQLEKSAAKSLGGARKGLLWLLLQPRFSTDKNQADEGGYLVKLKGATIADLLGYSRETVARHISRLKESGVVSSHRGGVRVEDREALKSFFESC
ncbi:MAG: Crp/Fnr family transcriptional regulator [Candidatus Acetothermia bacterium]